MQPQCYSRSALGRIHIIRSTRSFSRAGLRARQMHSRSACSAALANCAPAYCASARKVLGRGSHTATRPANISFRSQCTRIARCSVAAGDAALTPGSSDDARSSSAEEHGNSASANPHVQQAVSSARARQDQQSEQAPKQRSILKNFLIAIGNAVGQCLRALSNLQSASADQLRSNRVGRFLLWLIGKLFASDYNQSKVTGEDTAVNQAYLVNLIILHVCICRHICLALLSTPEKLLVLPQSGSNPAIESAFSNLLCCRNTLTQLALGRSQPMQLG
jgi:hypothetical protein